MNINETNKKTASIIDSGKPAAICKPMYWFSVWAQDGNKNQADDIVAETPSGAAEMWARFFRDMNGIPNAKIIYANVEDANGNCFTYQVTTYQKTEHLAKLVEERQEKQS